MELNFTSLLVMGFIFVIVGTALLPSLAQNVGTAQAETGIINTPSSTILGLSTLMFVLIILSAISLIVFIGLRYLGMT